MIRTPAQKRLGSAYHEGAHAAAGRIYGWPVQQIRLMGVDGSLVEGEFQGDCSFFPRESPLTLGEAVESMTVLMAGHAGYRLALALGVFTSEAAGATGEIPSEVLATVPPEAAGTPRADVFIGFFGRDGEPDEVHAREIASNWTENPLEREALLSFAMARSATLADGEMFQAITRAIAQALLDASDGVLSAEQVVGVCVQAEHRLKWAHRASKKGEESC